jgi:hypothetical protein
MDDIPVLVFSGHYAEALFLKTLIESAGIETSFEDLPIRGVRTESRLYVKQADVDHASELVADFQKNGHRTTE